MTISEKTVKTEKTDSKKKVWKSCGYLSKSKNPKVLVVMVKHKRFIVNVNGLQAVLNGKIEYSLIYEYIDSLDDSVEEWQQLEKSRKAELMAINKEIEEN
jgi:hypothetical protein